MRFIITMLFVALCASSAFPQSRKPTKPASRVVIVHTTQGEVITGKFAGATADAVQVQDATGLRVIDLEQVATLTFGIVTPAYDRTAARDAARALVRLASATSVELNYRDYAAKLTEVKGIVDEALRKLPDGQIRQNISRSISFYMDALSYWRDGLAKEEKILIFSDTIFQSLVRQFGPEIEQRARLIPGSTSKSILADYLIVAIWQRAGGIALSVERDLEKTP